MNVFSWLYACIMRSGACRSQEAASHLELQVIVSSPGWLLGNELAPLQEQQVHSAAELSHHSGGPTF